MMRALVFGAGLTVATAFGATAQTFVPPAATAVGTVISTHTPAIVADQAAAAGQQRTAEPAKEKPKN